MILHRKFLGEIKMKFKYRDKKTTIFFKKSHKLIWLRQKNNIKERIWSERGNIPGNTRDKTKLEMHVGKGIFWGWKENTGAIIAEKWAKMPVFNKYVTGPQLHPCSQSRTFHWSLEKGLATPLLKRPRQIEVLFFFLQKGIFAFLGRWQEEWIK